MQINELITKTGSVENAIDFIKSALPNSSNKEDISLFITFSVANYFGISAEDVIKEDGKINAAHRMVCYQLHKECLSFSIRKTGKVYKRKENAVMRGLHMMDDVLKKPSLDIKSYECFIYVKNQVQKSIEYLKKND